MELERWDWVLLGNEEGQVDRRAAVPDWLAPPEVDLDGEWLLFRYPVRTRRHGKRELGLRTLGRAPTRHDGIGRRVLAQVAIDEHQSSIWQLPGQQRIRISDLGQKIAQSLRLRFWMTTPVLGIGQKVSRVDPAQLADPVANHRSRGASMVRRNF